MLQRRTSRYSSRVEAATVLRTEYPQGHRPEFSSINCIHDPLGGIDNQPHLPSVDEARALNSLQGRSVGSNRWFCEGPRGNLEEKIEQYGGRESESP
ncbi:hypothetical protein J6590_041837 [Homalodisca vitripennis]|nr:hypothetical protein J6590_041837 [Homalodisca vitripennis]